MYRINAGVSSQVHVGYLDHLISWGIIGSIFYFGFLIMVIWEFRKTALHSQFWGSFYAICIFMFANLTLVKHHMFFYGILYAFVFNKYFESKKCDGAARGDINSISLSQAFQKKIARQWI